MLILCLDLGTRTTWFGLGEHVLVKNTCVGPNKGYPERRSETRALVKNIQ